ncbi:hypothetical protein [Kitasatospora aureofaciens]|nr:hypothetical protein [Kitasatospora aureofaciens]
MKFTALRWRRIHRLGALLRRLRLLTATTRTSGAALARMVGVPGV